jgi:hypothetical protein
MLYFPGPVGTAPKPGCDQNGALAYAARDALR